MRGRTVRIAHLAAGSTFYIFYREMLRLNKIYCWNCLEFMRILPDKCIDLVITDPPYLIENTRAGWKSNLAESIQWMNTELWEWILTEWITDEYLEELVRVCKNTNIYLRCNHKQIKQYLDFFVWKYECKFDILIWNKTNATPLFHNKYLTDKEYCLYFRKWWYCDPKSYESAKTVFNGPINIIDKNLRWHPTIKPLEIIKRLVDNSSKIWQTILDPFLWSWTTAIACKELGRNRIGIEIEQKYVDIANKRLETTTVSLF